MVDKTLVMGAVAYAPKVVTIWDGFKEYFAGHGLAFDYVLFSNYERQVQALFDGAIDVAWNSPLAWIRAERIGRARGEPVRALAMRDTDCDLTSVVVVRTDSAIKTVADLKGRRVGVGAIDSPQATLIPLNFLRERGLQPSADFTVRRFDVLGGKHGDHIGGERDAALALMAGEVDAACMIDGNHLLFVSEGTLPAGRTRVLAQTPPYDHCNFTVTARAPGERIEQLHRLLLSMSYADATVRPLLDLEGLKAWKQGRTSGYALLEKAVDVARFYDAQGAIVEPEYRY
ncbi:MAG TPA: phosphate/phosphite/phosphonate ABC transporter substrate-binding protein [Burkholderiaceae bacterium]|nr:phosphate/phosphite/phosphonate ABC transporter substrate-binding protein [Burkholderiaceae bacterium]